MSEILVQQDGALCRITLNRPDKANALTEAMLTDLRDAVRAAEGRALILTGAGKVFSAGADLEAAKAGLAVSPLWEELSSAIEGFGGLSVAALNGSCAGGAMGMMLACDLRVAVPTARFFYPVMRLGYLPQPSDPGRLRALVGPSRSRLILMSGAKIAADEALAMGLVDRLTEDAPGEAESLCADVLAAKDGHPDAIGAMI